MSSSKSLRMNVKMNEQEVDDVAFLTGEGLGANKRVLYERDRIAVCSQKRALGLALFVFLTLFLVALIIAFATPLSGCSLNSSLEFDGGGYDENSEGEKFRLPSGEEYPWKDSRLPPFVRPLHYTISIHPNLTTLDVTGWVVIHFVVDKETPFIVFHARNMRITEKWVREGVDEWSLDPEKLQNISRLLEYPPYQQWYLEFSDGSCLYPDKNYSLGIRFQTKISLELEGFYLSSYTTPTGEKRVLATTHFEPTYARSAFPCFDEPQLKATFKMIIHRNQIHKSLFNMPIKKIESVYYGYNVELWRDEFEESVEMSTYLVAFVVCDYDSITNRTKKNVEVSIHTPPPLLSQGTFALETAVKLMDFYDGFFGIPYPLPKQDLIAIPDFGAGAMENWGLITYRETSILYDPNESSSAAHQWVAVVVAHELAHQWFGNLVTMVWWNDLWLNEGFASFAEYVGVDEIRPEWKMMEQFVLEKTQPALALDALSSSHPISVSVQDPKSIESIFDTISYSKGAAILRMLEVVMGEEALRRGLTQYLNKHKFRNANTDDLWAALTASTNYTIQVKTIMDSWTVQMGFPLVRISLENRTVKVRQEGFELESSFPSSSSSSSSVKNQTSPPEFPMSLSLSRRESASGPSPSWYIPLTYLTDSDPKGMKIIWLNTSDPLEFPMPFRADWIKFNVNQTGFYRVQYEGNLWNVLINLLLTNPNALSPTDRANLLDDAFTLSKAGVISAQVPLELSGYLLKETEYVPWATALDHFRTWIKVLHEKPAHRLLISYLLKLLEPIYRTVTWEDDGPHLLKLLRGDILAAAIHCEHKDAIREAKKRFTSWTENGVRVPPNLREVVYSAGVKFGGVMAWDHCWSTYNKTQVPSERKILLKSLGSASDPYLLQQYLEACLERDNIRPQDVRTVFGVVASNPAGRLLAWRHLRAHWDGLETMFGEGSFTMGSLITAVVTHFSNQFDYNEVLSFFGGRDVGSGQRALNQSLEMIRLNIHWLDKNERTIEDWLRRHH